jgi:hypothetical protein
MWVLKFPCKIEKCTILAAPGVKYVKRMSRGEKRMNANPNLEISKPEFTSSIPAVL